MILHIREARVMRQQLRIGLSAVLDALVDHRY
jgi:hypothetical protein